MNIENYEAFLLDYLEGNLPIEREKEFWEFLDKHPHIKDELEELSTDFDTTISPPPSVEMDKSNLLKQTYINKNNKEEVFIESIEGLLNTYQEEELRAFLETHPKERPLYSRYKRTILTPNTSITLSSIEKRSLKKRSLAVVARKYGTYAAVAASVVWLLFIVNNEFFTALDQNNPVPTSYVEVTQPTDLGDDHLAASSENIKSTDVVDKYKNNPIHPQNKSENKREIKRENKRAKDPESESFIEDESSSAANGSAQMSKVDSLNNQPAIRQNAHSSNQNQLADLDMESVPSIPAQEFKLPTPSSSKELYYTPEPITVIKNNSTIQPNQGMIGGITNFSEESIAWVQTQFKKLTSGKVSIQTTKDQLDDQLAFKFNVGNIEIRKWKNEGLSSSTK